MRTSRGAGLPERSPATEEVAATPASIRPGRTARRAFSTALALVVAGLAACEPGDEEPSRLELTRARLEGIAFLEENRLEEAEDVFARIVEMAPDDPEAWMDLAVVHLRAGRLEEARGTAERAVALDPDGPEARLALARVLELSGERAAARDELDAALDAAPEHRRALYARARLAADAGDWAVALPDLDLLVELMDGNVVARLELIEALLRTGDLDAAAGHLETLRQQLPVLPVRAQDPYEATLDAVLDGREDAALAAFPRVHDALRTTGRYQQDRSPLRGPGGVLDGMPDVAFLGRGPRGAEPGEVAQAIRFSDVTAAVGLEAEPPRVPAPGEPVGLAVGDLSGAGGPDVYVGSGLLFRQEGEDFAEVGEQAGLPPGAAVADARMGDIDNDGRQELLLVGDDGAVLLLEDQGDGSLTALLDASADPAGTGGAAAGHLVDADHDGDLDVVVVGPGPARFYRNDLDGTFPEVAEPMGLAGAAGGTDVAFADLNDDDVIDLVVSRADAPPSLLLNRRESRFEDVAEATGLAGDAGAGGPATAVAVGDYDNDGWPDLFLGGTAPGNRRLLRSVEGSAFEVDERPAALYGALADLRITDALFLDYDNDGWLDLLVAGEPEAAAAGEPEGPEARGLRLFRNAGPGEWTDASPALPRIGAASRLATLDFTGDGDLDVLVTLPDGRVRLLRNDGGNVNHTLALRLVGLTSGAGRNNHFGIGAKVEVRAGALYQARTVTGPLTVVGLGEHPRAEVVRIRWPNGVPQVLYYPGAQATVAEEQLLKGSCPFLYAWDGEGFSFVTDVLWQSALGMPVGIGGAGSGRTYAPPDPSHQPVRIPGTALAARNGAWELQLTSELWETIYVDRTRLVAVDHPDSVDVYVDERFPAGPPGEEPALHVVRERRAPAAATDHRGRDVLPALLEHDFGYVAPLPPGPYQGLTGLHDLVLELGDIDHDDEVRLFLRGWIFPSDAGINVALARNDALEVIPPFLQVRNEDGAWVTVVEALGFPAGKDKTVVVDLTGLFRSADRSVRIQTNMQIYWDHAFVATGRPDVPVRTTTLEPAAGDLWERGFSRMYRRGGRYGPHWFDWDDVSPESPWRPIRGRVTRTGDVRPLLTEADDRSVVMAPGDAVTVRFDAGSAPPLPDGWTRTFLFHPEGWVKDADLHTAAGHRTGPLPFRGMRAYPPAPGEDYPSTPEHRAYLETYQTRVAPTGSGDRGRELPSEPSGR